MNGYIQQSVTFKNKNSSKVTREQKEHFANGKNKRPQCLTWVTLPSWCGVSQSIHTTRSFECLNTDAGAGRGTKVPMLCS
jgi:hypothetical protein